MSTKVKRKLTPISRSEAEQALKTAWQAEFGEMTDKQAAILVAQWAFETGWGKSMYDYNFGNIKGADPKSGRVAYRRTEEFSGDERESVVQPFRAYENIEDGASDYISLLKRAYPNAIRCIKEEDPEGFVQALHEGGYFTEDPEVYSKGVSQISRQLAKFDKEPESSTTETTKSKTKLKPTSFVIVKFFDEMTEAMKEAMGKF